MNDPKKEILEAKARAAIKAMAARNIEARYYADPADAVRDICSMIPKDAVVALGGSSSVQEAGLVSALRDMSIDLLDPYKPNLSGPENETLRRRALDADFFIASANAVTADGMIVNEDSSGNRVAAMIYGPDKVVFLVSANKIVENEQAAVARIRNTVAPMVSARFNINSPCRKTGRCAGDCRPPHGICNFLTVIKNNPVPGRMHVVFVGQELGY